MFESENLTFRLSVGAKGQSVYNNNKTELYHRMDVLVSMDYITSWTNRLNQGRGK